MAEKKKKDDDSASCRVKVHIRMKQNDDKSEKSAAFNIFADGSQLQIPNSEGRLELDKWYRFDHIYSPISSNKEVYRLSSHDLVESSLKGLNAAIFAYGQTGSGKTRTLMSKDGVMAHMVSHLFNRIMKSTDEDYKVAFSYFQIYNERIYDLLNPHNTVDCAIRECADKSIYVENLARVLCETPMDVYELINVGRKALMVGETKMNRLSSRSHTICQVSIEKQKRNPQRNKRAMQETSQAVPDLEKPQIEIDFSTLPFDQKIFKKRLSAAVAKANENKASPRSPRSSVIKTPDIRTRKGSAPVRSRTGSPSRSKHHRPRANSMKSNDSENSSLDGSLNTNLSKSSHLPVPQHKQRSSTYTVNETGLTIRDVDNVVVLNDLYQSNIEECDSNQPAHFIQFNPDEFDEDENEKRSTTEYADSECIDYGEFYKNDKLDDEENDDDDDDEDDEDGDDDDYEAHIIYSKISIIDLAGSERLSEAHSSDPKRMKENQNINLSLLELGNVVSALAGAAGGKKKQHVPYRNSVLTRFLQDTLGGNCKTKFILFVSTKLIDVHETKCTLEFGQKLREVCNKPVLNFDIDWRKRYEDLLVQLEEKRKEEEAMRKERLDHLAEFQKEKEKAKETLREQELLIVLLQTKLNTSDMEQKKQNVRFNNLQKLCEDKDDMITTKDVEVLKYKMELDNLSNKLAARIFLTEQCIVESNKTDVGTNTSLPNLTVADAIDGSIDLIFADPDDDDSCETPGSIYMPSYEECLDVSMSKVDNFSENGFFVETQDATTNTWFERHHVATSTRDNEEPPKKTNPIVVTFMQSTPKPIEKARATSDVTTNTPTTSGRRDSGYVECSTQTDLSSKYRNIDRVRSAILVELLSLQKLCQRSKVISDEPMFQGEMLTGHDDYTTTLNDDTDSISDGLSSVIAEIFNILPNMFGESSYTTDNGYESQETGYINRITPIGVKYTRPKEQLVFLQDYLRNRKKSIDKDLLNIAYRITRRNKESHRDSDTVLEQKIIEELIEKLSDGSSSSLSNLEELKKLLNIVLCDHTITACLLALTQKQNLYYYNYSETDFDLMSNSTVESSAEFNNNNSSSHSYELATRSWSDRDLKTPQSIATLDVSDGSYIKKHKSGLNKLFRIMSFKRRKSGSKRIKGRKDE